jgi:hypothetical protein
MLPPRKPAMPTEDLEGQLLEDPPADMIPARNAKEVEQITQELLMRMQSASPEEKAQIAELLSRVNSEADPTKPGADPTMTQPFMDALSQLPAEARDEYMQMAGGLPMLMGDEPMPDDGSRYEPPSQGMPNEMPEAIPDGQLPNGQSDSIPAYMARQQDMPMGQQQNVDLMALLGGGNMPQQSMNMESGQRFLGGLMG